MEFNKKAAEEYAKLNLKWIFKEEPTGVECFYPEEFLKCPWYLIRYYIGKDMYCGCYCEYKKGVFAPIKLTEILPELFRMSPGGECRMGEGIDDYLY